MKPMPDSPFLIKDAAQILSEAGLLAGLLVPQADFYTTGDLRSVNTVKGSFMGAGLDSRSLESGQIFIALDGEKVDGRKFIHQVLEKGHWVLAAPTDDLLTDLISCSCTNSDGGVLWSRDPEAALALLGSTWRQRQVVKVVGITGTNGKTTTKDLLAAMLRGRGETLSTAGNFNNHLGLPITLLSIRSEHEFAVVEMGASAVGEIAFLAGLARPDVGIITNASEAHLAEFGSLEGIILGKGELLDQLPASGLAVLNADSPGFEAWEKRASCAVCSFGQNGGDYSWSMVPGKDFSDEVSVTGVNFPVPLPGHHNGANLVAGLLAARHLGLSDKEIKSGLAEFRGSPHRGILLSMGGRQVLDDCYNANPRSMLAAVATLLHQNPEEGHLAILGHMAELGDDSAGIHRQTGSELAALGLKKMIVVGEEAKAMLDGFDETGSIRHYCSTLEAAAEIAAKITHRGDCILIKGSRSAAMENILPMLRDQWDRE
jgi:UDP-N-acetylmuramoyl-tripeptide--D-alanyl-D-alanine ligase